MEKIFEVYEFKVRVDIFRYYSFRDGRTGKEFQRLDYKIYFTQAMRFRVLVISIIPSSLNICFMKCNYECA